MPLKDKAARARYLESYRNRPGGRAYTAAKNKAHQNKIRDAIWERKSRPCADCGVQYPPWVMDLDHRDQADKHHRLAQTAGRPKATLWTLPWAERLAEIEKCDVVCANRHRERTYQKKQTSFRRDAATPEADDGQGELRLEDER